LNKEMYLHVLGRLNDAAGRTNSWFLRHNYAPAHRSVVVKDFLSKTQSDNTGACPVPPDLPPADFYLFPRLQGRRFCDYTDIIKNAAKELKRLSENVLFSNTFAVAGRNA
jgi:hypothetical protein